MEALAATVIGSFLYPAIKAGWDVVGEKVGAAFGEAAGDQAAGLTKRLWQRVRDAFGSDGKEATTLDLFEEDPDTYSTAVERLLAQRLDADPDLARELESLVNEPIAGTTMSGAQIMNAENVGLVDLRQADFRNSTGAYIVGQKIEASPRGASPGGG
jgi:hypothetical protein